MENLVPCICLWGGIFILIVLGFIFIPYNKKRKKKKQLAEEAWRIKQRT